VNPRAARLRALADACDAAASTSIRAELGAGADELAVAAACALGAAYPALRGRVVKDFASIASIAREGFRAPRRRAELHKRLLAACRAGADVGAPPGALEPLEQLAYPAVRRGLRRGTFVERLRIALRELDPDIDVDATAREWGDLASAQLEIALAEARAHVERRFGAVRTTDGLRVGFVVLGLGKLGGSELNAGSDVDLIYLHETDDGLASFAYPPSDDDEANGVRPFDAFVKIAQRLTATLDEHDDDGFCARVDLRLRPEGGSGPLVNSVHAALNYYESFGRAWERAALLRARPVAGDLAVGEHALAELVPFVFRRRVDPGIALDMHDMVRRGRVELCEDPARDLKLGEGGIREAEFFVQTLQLIWGGRDPAVRSTNTLAGLRRLRTRGYVSDREARDLEAGYLLLRRVEHRVQLSSGVQTHLLPREGEERERIARSLGFASGVELWAALERVRERIAERFASLVPGRRAPVSPQDERIEAILQALDALPAGGERGDRAERASVLGSEALATALQALARRPDAPLGGVTRERHPRFVRGLLRAVLDAADPELAAALVRNFFARLAPPGVDAYVRTFEADERALARFVGLCGASTYLGRSLVGHPERVDLVLFAAHGGVPGERRGVNLLENEIAALSPSDRIDAEAFVGALRRARAVLELEVGMRDLAGEIGVREAGRALSLIAEATLDAATHFALDELARRRGLAAPPAGLAVLAMGKLGGLEIGYGSDLDVVFVYDPEALVGAGLDPLDAQEIFGRAATRVIRLISAPHEEGPGFELDTRLRPSGEQGALVVSLEAFRAYHLGSFGRPGSSDRPARAEGWERQALLRLRACAGDRTVGAAVEAIAHEAAYEVGAVDPGELLRIRRRLEDELARERPGRFDPKLGKGGLADVEFAVQYLQMRHGHDARVRSTETLAALEALEARGYVDAASATSLRDGYRFLRRLEQRARVVHASRAAYLEVDAEGLLPLARSMGYRDRDGGAGAQLIETYRETTEEVRRVFLALLSGVAPGSPSAPPSVPPAPMVTGSEAAASTGRGS
jgi:glutamate-ammonia-ligase adenylyltransferase